MKFQLLADKDGKLTGVAQMSVDTADSEASACLEIVKLFSQLQEAGFDSSLGVAETQVVLEVRLQKDVDPGAGSDDDE